MDLSLLSDDDDSNTAFLNPDLLAQQDALAQRKALLVQAAKDSANQVGVYAPVTAQQQPGWTSAVISPGASSGAHMLAPLARTSFLQAAAPLVADAALGMRQSQYNDDLSGYNRLSQAAIQQHMASMPQPTTADDGTVTQPTLQDKLAWAEKGSAIPSLAPVMADFVKDQLINAPGRDATKAIELAKFNETQRHNKATEGKAANANFIPIKNDAGQFTGSFDSRSNSFFDASGKQVTGKPQGNATSPDDPDVPQSVNGAPPTAARPATPIAATSTRPTQSTQPVSTSTNDVPGPPGTPANAAPAVSVVPGVQGTSSGANQKQVTDQNERTRQATNTLATIDTAHGMLKNTISGYGDTASSFARTHNLPFAGQPNEQDANKESLEALSQWLASEFPRGPGAISDFERKIFAKAVANIGDSTVDWRIRANALDTVAEKIAKSAGLPVPPKQGPRLPTQASTPSSTQAAPAAPTTPATEEGYRQASRAAQAAYLKSQTPANKAALEQAQTDLVRFQSQGNSPAGQPSVDALVKKYTR